MSKIYTVSKNTQPTNPSFVMHLAFLIFFLFALTTVSHAYECELQEDGACLIYMIDELPEASVQEVLDYCDDINGTYYYEEDICVIK